LILLVLAGIFQSKKYLLHFRLFRKKKTRIVEYFWLGKYIIKGPIFWLRLLNNLVDSNMAFSIVLWIFLIGAFHSKSLINFCEGGVRNYKGFVVGRALRDAPIFSKLHRFYYLIEWNFVINFISFLILN